MLILGILLGKYVDIPINISLFVITFGLTFLWVTYKQRDGQTAYSFEIISLLLVLALGVLIICLHKPKNQPWHYLNLQEEVSETYAIKVVSILRPGTFNNRYLAALIPATENKMRGKLLLHSPDSIQLNIDEELLLWKPWKPIDPPLNPGQFNYARYMADQGVFARIDLKPTNFVRLPKPAKTWRGRIGRARAHLSRKINEMPLEADTKDIMRAMLLGQRNTLDATLYEEYKDAGAVHLLAISGLHVGILVLMLQFILVPLRRFSRGEHKQFVSIVLFLWAYAALAGFTPSVVRAVTMFSFVTYALVIKRSGNSYNIIALSLFFILLVLDPNFLFQAGFQMSYAAVLAILWLYPKLISLWHPKSKILGYFWQLLAVSISAQVGVLPISLYYFHQFPGLFFISNLLIVPMLGLVLGLGFLLLVLSLIQTTPVFLFKFYDQLLIAMNTIVQWVAQQENFILRDIPFDGVQVFLSYSILILLIAAIEYRKTKFVWITGCSILLFQVWAFRQKLHVQNRSELILYHQVAQTLLVEEYAEQAHVFIRKKGDAYSASILQNAAVHNRIKEMEVKPLENSYVWKGKHILLVDKTGIHYTFPNEIDFLILTDNPKVNLDRVLTLHPHARIIADGSNYTFLIDTWRASCSKAKRPFHYTGEKGAYYFEKNIL